MSTRNAWLGMIAALIIPVSASGQDEAPSRQGGFEIAPFIGTFDDVPEYDPDDSDDFVDPAGNPFFGAYLDYHFPAGLFIEGEFGFIPLEYAPAGETRRDTNLLVLGLGLGYNIPLGDKAQLYLDAGLGSFRWSPDGLDSESDFSLNYGTGLRVFLSDDFAVRFDARMHQLKALHGTSSTADAQGETMFAPTLTIGGSFFIRGDDDPEPMPAVEPEPEPEPEPEEPAPAMTFEHVLFDSDSAELDSTARNILQDVGRVLISRPGDVEIRGHADATASESYNEELSQRRAEAVRTYLLENFPQLESDRFRLQAFGESMPVAENETPEGRRLNRRVVIMVGEGR